MHFLITLRLSVFLLLVFLSSVSCSIPGGPINFYIRQSDQSRRRLIWVSADNYTVSRPVTADERLFLYSRGLHPVSSVSRVTLPRSYQLGQPANVILSLDEPLDQPYGNHTDLLWIVGNGAISRGPAPNSPPTTFARDYNANLLGSLKLDPFDYMPIQKSFIWEDQLNPATQGLFPPVNESELIHPGLAFSLQLERSGSAFQNWSYDGFYFVPEFDCSDPQWGVHAANYLENAEQQRSGNSKWLFELLDLPSSFRGYHFVLAVDPVDSSGAPYNPIVSLVTWSQVIRFQQNVQKVSDSLWIFRSPSMTFQTPDNIHRVDFLYQTSQPSINFEYSARIVLVRDIDAPLNDPQSPLCYVEPNLPWLSGSSDGDNSGSNKWAIVGGVAGGGVVLIVIILIALHRRNQKKADLSSL